MHPYITKQIKTILNGSIDNMISSWVELNEKYSTTENRTTNITIGKYLSEPYISLEDNMYVLELIKNKIFKKEIALSKPKLILDLMNQYWCYAEPDQIMDLEYSTIYKDANAMDLYQSIVAQKMYPDADPYFKINPEHEVKQALEYGVNRNLFSQADINKALINQNKNSSLYKEMDKLYSQIYSREHLPFGQKEGINYKDYGFHLFIGKKNCDNINTLTADDSLYVMVNYNNTYELETGIELITKLLWKAVCKNQKVLLTKHPADEFSTLSPNELCELYECYFKDSKHLELPDPFLNQPK